MDKNVHRKKNKPSKRRRFGRITPDVDPPIPLRAVVRESQARPIPLRDITTVTPGPSSAVTKFNLYEEIERLCRSTESEKIMKGLFKGIAGIIKQRNNSKWNRDLYTEINADERNRQQVISLQEILQMADDREGETLLHTVVKWCKKENNNQYIKKLVRLFVKQYPELLMQGRRQSSEYAGQTPLHMAVCKGNTSLAKKMLKYAAGKENSQSVEYDWHLPATGTMFTGTVMMGELPLITAALTFNPEMMRLLTSNGADLRATNRMGDTVCHSLIRYTKRNSESMSKSLMMCQCIMELDNTYTGKNDEGKLQGPDDANRRTNSVWLIANADEITPLQLAASMGHFKIFEFIMNIKGVYCQSLDHDGLFVTKEYDITDFEVALPHQTGQQSQRDFSNRTPGPGEKSQIKSNIQTSILFLLLELKPNLAFPIICFLPVMTVIEKKWEAYYRVVWIIMTCHFFFMCIFTWYSIERAQQRAISNSQQRFDTNLAPVFKRDVPYDGFTTSYAILSAVFAIVYGAQDLIRMVKGRMRWTSRSFKNAYSNGWFRIFIDVFSVCLIIDVFAAIWSDYYENYCLVIGIVVGWFLMLFFLRTIPPLSQFSLLIHQVLAGDIFRFSIILAIPLISFSTAMYMSIQGSNAINDEEYSDYGRIILSMFKLTVGLGDTPSIYETKHSPVGSIIFVAFILMTAVLIMNALIATMDQTSTKIVHTHDDTHSHERSVLLQRLSVILFIESILPTSWIHRAGKLKIQRSEFVDAKGDSKTSAFSIEITSLSTLH